MGFPPLLNLSTKLSTAALPSQTTKTALTLEFMFQNVAYRPTVYITGGPHIRQHLLQKGKGWYLVKESQEVWSWWVHPTKNCSKFSETVVCLNYPQI